MTRASHNGSPSQVIMRLARFDSSAAILCAHAPPSMSTSPRRWASAIGMGWPAAQAMLHRPSAKGGISTTTHKATSPAELESAVQQLIQDIARQYREVNLLDIDRGNLGWIH